MTVTHIFHSGFLVELEHTLLLFDYYKGDLPTLSPTKKLYVFVSHKHFDHCSPAIWELTHPNIEYVVFKDVPTKGNGQVLKVSPHETYTLNDLTITTLGSTDEGCAFVVTAEEKTFYHAGDLNWWHWEGEPEEDNLWQDTVFHQELARIEGQHFNCAFLPLDPRLQVTAPWGFLAFLKACTYDKVFPMHYENNKAAMLEYLKLPHLAAYKAYIVTDDIYKD